jgi:RNA polymerase sigma-70 factor, ECF subfamily
MSCRGARYAAVTPWGQCPARVSVKTDTAIRVVRMHTTDGAQAISAPANEISRLAAPGHRRRREQLRALATGLDVDQPGPDADRGNAAQSPRSPCALEAHPNLERRFAPSIEPLPCRRSPPAVDVIAVSRPDSKGSRARRLDRESQAWVEALHSVGLRRDEAIRSLHALVLREARFEVRRRTAPLAHPSGRDLDDLAVQAADDAVVAILAKLDRFRGDSLFTTWARRFAQREAPATIRRRLGRGRELPVEAELERARMWSAHAESPHERCVAGELARTLTRQIAEELTAHQREVLIALTIDGVATKDLARRLDTTAGALYKTLHDARRKLKSCLVDS